MFNRIKLLIYFINFFSRNSRMAILGRNNWEFINNLRDNPGKERFYCDFLGFVTGFGDAGLQKDQGADVLDALGLIVLSPKDSRRNSAAVRTSDRILH